MRQVCRGVYLEEGEMTPMWSPRRVGAVEDKGCGVSFMGWKNQAAMADRSGGSRPRTNEEWAEVIACVYAATRWCTCSMDVPA